MRLQLLMVVTTGLLVAAATATGQAAKTDEDKLQGTWIVVSVEAGGQELDKAITDEKDEGTKHQLQAERDSLKSEVNELKGVRFIFNNSRMSRKNKDGKESKDGKEKWNINGTYKLNSTKSPKEIDVTCRIGPGGLIVLKGIYLLEGDRLKMCFSSRSVGNENETVRPSDFKGSLNRSDTLFILKHNNPKR